MGVGAGDPKQPCLRCWALTMYQLLRGTGQPMPVPEAAASLGDCWPMPCPPALAQRPAYCTRGLSGCCSEWCCTRGCRIQPHLSTLSFIVWLEAQVSTLSFIVRLEAQASGWAAVQLCVNYSSSCIGLVRVLKLAILRYPRRASKRQCVK